MPAATVPGGLDAELGRLRAQAELTWSEEFDILAPRLHPTLPLLDLGCGPGEVARLMSATRPDLDVVGLDADLLLAGHAATHGPVAVGRAEALPLRTGSIGTVLSRYVFQHLPEPGAVLAEISRVLVPGGWVMVVDIDEAVWGACEPRIGGVDRVYAAAAARQTSAGGDRRVVRRLTGALADAGFTDVALKPFAVDTGTRPLADLAVHLAPDRLLPAVADGTISAGDYGVALAAHQRFLHHHAPYAMLLGFAAIGRTPTISG